MPALAWVKAIHLAATALVAGAFAFQLLVLARITPRPHESAALPLRRRLHALAGAGLAVAAVSWLAWLALLAVSMSGLPPDEALALPVLGTVIARTTFGHVWVWRCGLLLAMAAVLAVQWRKRAAAGWAGAGIAAPLVFSLAWSGHATGLPAWHALVDGLHLLAASIWLGMLPPLWLVLRHAGARGDAAWIELGAACARRFSLPGMVAVATLAATGLGNALWLVDAPGDLVDTRYGELLLAKLGLFALMLGLAAANRLRFTPAAQPGAGADERRRALRHLRASVVLEVGAGAAVLVLVGVLGVTSPGRHDDHEHMHSMHEDAA